LELESAFVDVEESDFAVSVTALAESVV